MGSKLLEKAMALVPALCHEAPARPLSRRLTVRMARSLTMTVPRRGQANYGELGYGANGKKSSANPGKVDSLEGVKTQQVLVLPSHATIECWAARAEETVSCSVDN